MALIRSKDMLCVYKDDAVFSNITEKVREIDGNISAINWVAAEDAIFIGLSHKFNNRYMRTRAGENEVQNIAFDAVPDDGYFTLQFDGEETKEMPFDSTAEEIQNELKQLAGLQTVTVTGSFAASFDVTFVGADGNINQAQMIVGTNTLQVLPSTPVNITITTTTQGAQTSYAGSMTVAYWDGSAFTSFQSLIDETEGLSKSGWVQWEEKPEWKKATAAAVGITGMTYAQQLYWCKITLSTDLAGIELEAIKFLMSDDKYLKKIYPEVIKYLPESKADFFEQHELAKDYIIARLMNEGVIAYEEQVKDVSQWRMCAAYQCAVIILDPIAGDDRLNAVRERFEKKFTETYISNAANIDDNADEDLSETETEQQWNGSIGVYRR
jgi:hypothetical protein